MILLLLIALLPKEVYQDLTIGGRPLAMGYAASASIGEPSCIFFNPAGLAVANTSFFVLNYTGQGFDSLGRVKAMSLILPDVALSYKLLVNDKRFSYSISNNNEYWEDERYKIDEYIITATSRTANQFFSSEEPFMLGLNLKYFRGNYAKVAWEYTDSLWSQPVYYLAEGDGYGVDFGTILRSSYLQLGLFLKDIYSRMKWHGEPQITEKIKCTVRLGCTVSSPIVGISFDAQKIEDKISYHLGGEVKLLERNSVYAPSRCGFWARGSKICTGWRHINKEISNRFRL